MKLEEKPLTFFLTCLRRRGGFSARFYSRFRSRTVWKIESDLIIQASRPQSSQSDKLFLKSSELELPQPLTLKRYDGSGWTPPPPHTHQECWKKPRKVCQTLVTLKPKIVTEKVPKEVCEDYSLKVSIFGFSSSKICGGKRILPPVFADLSLLIICYGLQLISITKTHLVFRYVRVSETGTKAQAFNLFLIIRPIYEVKSRSGTTY